MQGDLDLRSKQPVYGSQTNLCKQTSLASRKIKLKSSVKPMQLFLEHRIGSTVGVAQFIAVNELVQL